MKKLFIFLSLITILYTIFYPSFVLKKDTFEPVQKEEIFVDIDHSKQLDDDTDIDSILVMVDKTTMLNADDIKNINVKDIKDLTDFSEYGENIHREDCVHSNKEITTKIIKIELIDGGKENILDAITKIKEYDGVIYAEPNYKGSFFINTPNDVSLTTDWYIQKIGLDKAWEISTGSSLVNVGVADSGIDNTHTDLSGRVNTSLSNNLSHNSGTAMEPLSSHGTYVAGIIGAQGDNNYGSCGVNWNISLVSLRIDEDEYPYLEDMGCLIQAIYYAGLKNIPILNFSGGFTYDSYSLRNAVSGYAGLFICASGNGGNDHIGDNIETNGEGIYPAYYTYSNMITVSASDSSDDRASFSNYGANTVDLFAPGVSIRGSYMGGGVHTDDGTSAAAPIVTGVAALLKAVNPSLTTEQLKNAILNNVDQIPSLSDYCTTGGRLNAFKALSSVVYSTTTINDKLSINGFISGYSLNRSADLEIPDSFALYNSSTSTLAEVVAINNYAFTNDGYLNKITIPNGVESIGNEAFKNCSNLDEVIVNKATLPLTTLGSSVFSGCSSSLQIKVPNDRIADYKNMTNWSTYSNKIIPYTNDFTTINMSSSTNTTQTLTLDAGYNKLYKLNVIDQGTYDVRASTSANTTIKLYDSNYNLLETKSKLLTKTLSTGIYYVSIAYQSNTQSGTLYPLFKVHSGHSYDNHYQWTSLTNHKSYCSCGNYINDFHVVSPDAYQNGNQYAICLLCNGFASFGGTWHDGIGSFPYTLNGSFILPNGVIVLEEADMEAYLNGTLVFINPNENIDRGNNHIPCIIRREDEYILD